MSSLFSGPAGPCWGHGLARANGSATLIGARALDLTCFATPSPRPACTAARPPQAYLARRTAEGKNPKEIRRCLKRYLARKLYRTLTTSMTRATEISWPDRDRGNAPKNLVTSIASVTGGLPLPWRYARRHSRPDRSRRPTCDIACGDRSVQSTNPIRLALARAGRRLLSPGPVEHGRGTSGRSPGEYAGIDHIVLAVPDLADGVAGFEGLTGVRPVGRSHEGLGTANFLVGLGVGAYLEIIGPDPDRPRPGRPRPFGIDDLTASGSLRGAFGRPTSTVRSQRREPAATTRARRG